MASTLYSASRLQYLRTQMSAGELYKKTGIHWNTQNAIISERIIPDRLLKKQIKSLYRSISYDIFRKDAFSVKQARRMRDLSPSHALHLTIQHTEMINILTERQTQTALQDLEQWKRAAQYSRVYAEKEILIREGMAKSLLSTEEQWDKYRV